MLCIFGERTFVRISWMRREANSSLAQQYRGRDPCPWMLDFVWNHHLLSRCGYVADSSRRKQREATPTVIIHIRRDIRCDAYAITHSIDDVETSMWMGKNQTAGTSQRTIISQRRRSEGTENSFLNPIPGDVPTNSDLRGKKQRHGGTQRKQGEQESREKQGSREGRRAGKKGNNEKQ